MENLFTAKGEVAERLARTRWFYEYALPDGHRTGSDLPAEAVQIHESRRRKLAATIERNVSDAASMAAADLSSHQGFFSIELAKHFKTVRGLDYRAEHLDDARFICDQLGVKNVGFEQIDLQTATYKPEMDVDFVLLYGLLYHLEDPIHTIRLASHMARKHILVETQVFPYDMSGRLEDGHYVFQRPVEGMFALVPDYSNLHMGGSTDLALVPSLNALLYLLRFFGFEHVEVLPSSREDYEQFRRGSRVVVYGQKA